MKNIFSIIVDKKNYFLSLFVILAVIFGILMSQVTVNTDMSVYLPEDSETKAGYEVLEEQFGTTSILNVMFKDLTDTQVNTLLTALAAIENVDYVNYDESETYNVDNYTLFVLQIPYKTTSDEAVQVIDDIETAYPEAIFGGMVYNDNQPLLPTYLIVIALIILVVILFIFTHSWIEPLLFILSIAIAILINMGSNIIFDNVSVTTYSIAALLQLCLSIDYSIILMNRYRQEKQTTKNKNEAMKNALNNAFPSIFGSSFTTIVGLLCLIFLSFTIGADMGLVLAKGVFISLLTVFFVLPSLILLFDKIIEKTSKAAFHLNNAFLSRFSYKGRIIAPVILVLLFVFSIFFRGNTDIGFVLDSIGNQEVSEVFPENNVIVILYNNNDETMVPIMINTLNQDGHVEDITSYYSTIGFPLNATELSEYTGMDEASISGMLTMNGITTISIYDFVTLVNENYSQMLTPEQAAQLVAMQVILEDSRAQLVGEQYSRMVITTTYAFDSDETRKFIVSTNDTLATQTNHDYYIIGESAMAQELSKSFNQEYLMITLITILAIFTIVALTFKSIIIPSLLVFIIQTAIFITTGVLGLLGKNVYFLALLIVQAILMGATIDYGILFTSYFKENLKTLDLKTSLIESYKGSMHTILTSSSILFIITGFLGIITSDPTLIQVLRALAVGTMSATLLVIFVLPSVLILSHKILFKFKK